MKHVEYLNTVCLSVKASICNTVKYLSLFLQKGRNNGDQSRCMYRVVCSRVTGECANLELGGGTENC